MAEKKIKKGVKKTKSIKVKDDGIQNALNAEKTEKERVKKETDQKRNKKILYIEIDDEVTTIFDRIRDLKQKNIYLVIPKRAIIFQSVVNLKILRRKSDDIGKTLSIITSDPNGSHLAGLVGLPVYESIQTNLNTNIPLVRDDEPDIAPLKAAGNSMRDETPTRLKERKLSISEFLHLFRRNNGLTTIRAIKRKKRPLNTNGESRSRFVLINPNKQALVGLVIASLLIFLVIIYIALPGATIYLTPKSTVLEKSVNVALADYAANRAEFDTHPEKTIATYPVNLTYGKNIQYASTGKIFKGENARGKIKVTNESNQPWPLVAKTRFQNSDGIVFRTQSLATVPAKVGDQAGSIVVDVVADEFDAHNQIVGDRGNLEPTKFFLPALRADNQAKLYGENEAPMTGGKTSYVKTITQEDLTAAENTLRAEIKKEAFEQLKLKVQEQAAQVGSEAHFDLLNDDKALIYSDIRVSIPQNLVDQQLDNFEIRGEVDLAGIYFNKDELLEILRNELTLKKSPEKKIVKIDDNSIYYSVFEQDAAHKKVKITASIKGIEEYEIDQNEENGRRLSKIIRDHVVGKKVNEAKDYIQNLPEINKVEIKSWPSWAPTMPSVTDNIEVEIVQDE